MLLAIAQLPVVTSLALATGLLLIELGGPWIAERKKQHGGTPRHPHHIAERYGLLVIITLGEGVIGTVAALNVVVHGPGGWSLDAALVGGAGIGLIFGIWWMYFAMPFGELLHARPSRAFRFGYGHLPIFAGLAAYGGGLRVAADWLQYHTRIGAVATVLSVAVPVAVVILALFAIWTAMTGDRDPFHLALLAATGAVLLLSILPAATGTSMAICLVILAGAHVADTEAGLLDCCRGISRWLSGKPGPTPPQIRRRRRCSPDSQRHKAHAPSSAAVRRAFPLCDAAVPSRNGLREPSGPSADRWRR